MDKTLWIIFFIAGAVQSILYLLVGATWWQALIPVTVCPLLAGLIMYLMDRLIK